MKLLLFVIYLIVIADAYYATLFIEPKTPPQHQTMKGTTITMAQLR
ncbi:hypothetical protein [Lysinibacillus parviboronicapiens]|nr:hypothetical protein [Lysinibacillus parviboronicapiens]